MIRTAIAVAALKARHKTFLHAALLVRNGRILGAGWNEGTTHAEQMALYAVSGTHTLPALPDGVELLSVRIRRSGRLGMARPCPACWALATRSGVRRVRYSDSHGNIVSERV